ncbi:MAG TPA: FlgD immunoglobulin-like domain containing protein [Candidatus Eisenbacteria bacterium]|nr:FlgD immunoglobulin-like domain containing protein [Candidatus Eisenbacteria bacterium]
MRRRILPCFIMFGVLVVPGLFGADPARAVTGNVLSYQKISDLAGNFTAPLTNLCELGGSATYLGDLDGGGPSVGAIAVGAALDDDGGGDRGAVFIMFLNATGGVLSYQKISDTQGNFPELIINVDQFGSSVASLGDLDGAGPSAGAIAVGAVGEDDGGTDRGCVYILFLSTTGNVLSYTKISDTVGNLVSPLDNLDEFGGAVANLGDLDGTGPSVTALAVGAVGDDDGGGDRGAVYILFLSSTGTVLSERKISDTQGNFQAVLDNADDFGSSVTALGDLDGPAGPGESAIAVGATFDDDGGIDRGAVYILFLNAAGTVIGEQKISDLAGNFQAILADSDEFGGAVQWIGDLDGTGGSAASLAIGVAGDDDGGEDRGAVYIVYLGPNGVCTSSSKISDFFGNFTAVMHNLDAFGTSLAWLGDYDGAPGPPQGAGGPSVAGVVVGMTGDDDGGTDRGAVYVLFLDGLDPTVSVPPMPWKTRTGVLGRAAPNPFHPGLATRIDFRLDEAAQVRIDVWDVTGRQVRTLVDGFSPAGEHQVLWDGLDDAGRTLATGTYFYRMAVVGRAPTKSERVLLLR